MRALTRTGSSKTLELDHIHPEPTADAFPNSYIVQIKAIALTRGELAWPEPQIPETPIPGYDFAGVVTAVPESAGSNKYKLGDEVYGLTHFDGQGNAREYVAIRECELSLKPRSLTWTDAAAVPLSALSAWQGLFVHGRLSALEKGENRGKRVLVTAASGGVGIWAVQLAHRANIHVVGTCGPSNVDFVRGLGADDVLNYTKTDLLAWVDEDPQNRRFDVVIECIGGTTLLHAWNCLKENGKIISVAEPADTRKPPDGVAKGVKGVWFIVEAYQEQLGHITKLIDEGKCRGQVDQVFDLEHYKEAFERLESGHAKGKVILKIS